MAEKEVVAKELKIKQKAVFDMGELYQTMFRWFSQHNYDFQEKQYMEKKNPDGGKNLEIKWIATRKINDYVKFQIDIVFTMVNLLYFLFPNIWNERDIFSCLFLSYFND